MPKLLFKDVDEKEIGKTIQENQKELERIRLDFEDIKQSSVDLSLPIRGEVGDYMPGSAEGQGRGQKRGYDIYDDETVVNLEILVNGMQGMHVSPAFPWFLGEFYEKELREENDVKDFFRDASEVIIDVLRRSETFYSSIGAVFADAFGPGDGCIHIEPNLPNMSVEAIVPNLWQMYYSRDAFGKLAGSHRVYKMTAVQIKEESLKPGSDFIVPDDVTKALRQGKQFQEFELINAVYPNSDFDPRLIGPEHMPWSSYTIYTKKDNGQLLESKGYNTMNPIPLSVYRASDQDYGVGITGKAIVTIGTANQLSKTMLNAADWESNPAWKLNAGLGPNAELWPGGRTLVDDMKKESVEAIKTNIRWQVSDAERERITAMIRAHFMVDLLKQYSMLDKDMRVLELEQMMGENATQISAFMGIINAFLDKVLDRVFDIAWRAGWLPPLPQILVDFLLLPPEEIGPQPKRKMLIDYVGPLMQRQKRMFETQPIQMGLATSAPILERFPASQDLIDGDELLKINLNAHHFPTEAMRDEDVVAQMREQRAIDKQMAMAGEMAEKAAKLVPALQGETAEGSPLAELGAA